MIVYKVTNKISKKCYYGITENLYNRKANHKNRSKKENRNKRGGKTPFYDAIRKYGWENFNWEIIFEGSKKECSSLEIKLIKRDINCYNLHEGGSIGFSMKNKTTEEFNEWKNKLKKARKGKKPALGMSHSEENKKLFKKCSDKYWSTQKTYNSVEILNYGKIHGMTKTLKKYGISKTHYYKFKRTSINE